MNAFFCLKRVVGIAPVAIFAALAAARPIPPAGNAPQAQIANQNSDSQNSNQDQRRRGGFGTGQGGYGLGGARGMLGSVTEVAADHYTIKNDSGETYIIHFSANTRIVKQSPSSRRNGQNGGDGNVQPGGGQGRKSSDEGDRPIPENIKPTDIKVGDVITAAGEVDDKSKSIGAIFIAQVDPERAKQMREMQANYGKTWLAGRITAIDGTRITIEGMIDHAPHAVEVDENTSFRQRRDSITLGDIKPGEQLRAEGAMKSGVFLATTVNAMTPQNRENDRVPNRQADPKISDPKAPGSTATQPQ